MLITFTCQAYADITMFGDIAQDMIKKMGHSDTIPGAILAPDIPAAHARLKASIDSQPKKTAIIQLTDEQNEFEEPDEFINAPISLANRAMPLLALLAAASKENCHVMWHATNN